jgi:hypothetical protein
VGGGAAPIPMLSEWAAGAGRFDGTAQDGSLRLCSARKIWMVLSKAKCGDVTALQFTSIIDNRPQLTAEVIGYITTDNAFICIGDFVRA